MNMSQTLEGVSKMTEGTAAKVINIDSVYHPRDPKMVYIPISKLLKQFNVRCRGCDGVFCCEYAHLVGEHGECGCEMLICSDR